MLINFETKEVTVKLVYYGPALSGKTTNLKSLHQLTSKEGRGRLMTLETRDDRTLFFDMLPVQFKSEESGASIRLKVLTVPGQVIHTSTRRLVLQGADGIVFVADSQLAETEANAASFMDLKANLKSIGIGMKEMPIVIQFNKRDLPDIRGEKDIEEMARKGREPIFLASALEGGGVLETFFGLLKLTWSKLEQEHQLQRSLGIPESQVIASAAKGLGITRDTRQLLAKALGTSLEYKGAGSTTGIFPKDLPTGGKKP